jgi:hypothetical protein
MIERRNNMAFLDKILQVIFSNSSSGEKVSILCYYLVKRFTHVLRNQRDYDGLDIGENGRDRKRI